MLALSIGLWLVYFLACIGFGSLLRRLLAFKIAGVNRASSWVELATVFLLGQGLLANIWLLLSLGPRLTPLIVWLVIICGLCCTVFAWQTIIGFARQLRSILQGLCVEGLVWMAVAVLILLLVALGGVGALVLPPRGDSAAVYMVVPKVIAAAHQLTPVRGLESFAQLGLMGEMQHSALILLGSDRAAKLLVWSNSLVVAIMLLAICARVGLRRRGQLIASAILFTSIAFILIIPDGKVDLFAAAMGMGAFYWALRVREEGGTAALRLTGLFTGLAVMAKITYIVPLISGVLFLIVWRHLTSEDEETRSKSLIAWGMRTLVPLGIWMAVPVLMYILKNSLLFGEPLAPFISTQGQAWVDQTWFTPDITRWIVMTYPLALIFGEYPIEGGTLSALLLVFAPLILLLPRARPLVRSELFQITLAALVGTALWVMARPSVLAPRYILSSLLLFVPVVARSAEYASTTEKRPRLFNAGILVSIFLCLFITLAVTLSYLKLTPTAILRYAMGRLPECSVAGPECPALSLVNQQAQPGERIYLAAHFIYGLRPDLLECAESTDEKQSVLNFQTREAAWIYLYGQGFRYLIIDDETHASTAAALDLNHVPDWLKVVQLFNENSYRVLRLDSVDTNHQPIVTCRQTRPPVWTVVAP